MIDLRKPLESIPGLLAFFGCFLVGTATGFSLALTTEYWIKASDGMANLWGGIIGAGLGAALAVLGSFHLYQRQRKEEAAGVLSAVQTEVATFVKYVIGAIQVCQEIKNGSQEIPRQDVNYIIKNLIAGPVVYPAVADRVGLLPFPNATTEFYMRIGEAKAMADVLSKKTDRPGITYTTPRVENVSAEFAAYLADSLITALQIARPIVAGTGVRNTEQFAAQVAEVIVSQIDECLHSARQSFPDAVSFNPET